MKETHALLTEQSRYARTMTSRLYHTRKKKKEKKKNGKQVPARLVSKCAPPHQQLVGFFNEEKASIVFGIVVGVCGGDSHAECVCKPMFAPPLQISFLAGKMCA